MAAAAERSGDGGSKEKDLLSTVVGDIGSYSGSDPLRPWLWGMRKMEAVLPPAKLPRFLQKCAQEFQDDHRYLRVWIQLMDYVKDAKPLLKKMEKNRIGLKRVAFYMAYALYYEHRRFEDAENMYCLGMQKKHLICNDTQKEFLYLIICQWTYLRSNYCKTIGSQILGLQLASYLTSKLISVLIRFVGSDVVGEPKVENACHHGLVEPTVNLKEAMDDINNMFGRPLNFKDEKPKNKETTALSEREAAPLSGFSILADDDPEENPAAQVKPSDSCKFECQSDLFEPTITTCDVMAEINDMFGTPLDF